MDPIAQQNQYYHHIQVNQLMQFYTQTQKFIQGDITLYRIPLIISRSKTPLYI